MKIQELKIGTVLKIKTNTTFAYLMFRGCEKGFGKFIEVSKNGEILKDKNTMINYNCNTNTEELNMEIVYVPNISFITFFKEIFSNLFAKK